MPNIRGKTWNEGDYFTPTDAQFFEDHLYDGTGGGGEWGSITGTITNQLDLVQYIKEQKPITNLLKPTLGTSTQNGVTCTYNGDGTYTLNGTATSDAPFVLVRNYPLNGNYKLVGCPSGGSLNTYYIYGVNTTTPNVFDFGNGILLNESNSTPTFAIMIRSGHTCNNLVFNPMISPNLNATYDDFISYDNSIALNSKDDVQVIECHGFIANSIGGFQGYGTASVILLSPKHAKIDYQFRVTVAGTSPSVFRWGINANLLKSLNPLVPSSLTPIYGGNFSSFKSTGNFDREFVGYGSVHPIDGEFWKFARNYDGTQIGEWPETYLALDDIVCGTCYAIY